MAKDPSAGMTEAQRAYETRRAAEAGMTLETWLAQKERARTKAARAAAAATAPAPPPKRPGLLRRAIARVRGEA